MKIFCVFHLLLFKERLNEITLLFQKPPERYVYVSFESWFYHDYCEDSGSFSGRKPGII